MNEHLGSYCFLKASEDDARRAGAPDDVMVAFELATEILREAVDVGYLAPRKAEEVKYLMSEIGDYAVKPALKCA